MGNAVGQMLASAVGIAISPIPIIAVVLMLATERGRANGIAFTLAWLLTLGLVSTVVVLLGSGGGAHSDGGPATWTSWTKLVLGLVFLLLGVKQWTGRPKAGEEAQMPGWMRTVDSFTPGKSAGLAAALAGLNPKNLVLAVGGALSVAASTGGVGGKTVATVLFVLVGSLCALLPLGVYLLGGERAADTLQSWKTWMAAHNGAIMTVLLLILGAKYIGDAISALTA
ncbi:GAP family protein [Streptacidiphilus cavernicola]|uniref:GAP family protein n=1 Tax=Streptacidiphilus cavernicola TaxID=3342716 RepID=A0ABV6VMW0_9ACTN